MHTGHSSGAESPTYTKPQTVHTHTWVFSKKAPPSLSQRCIRVLRMFVTFYPQTQMRWVPRSDSAMAVECKAG